ncbi:hypothetical protein RJT34_29250 [Clitoria ternatea]|uniref:Uncharacterized protein n=1 Tax=Clitoria ternatea TaxID=43366 RepID=A0AAN9FCA1_CLITE
MEDDTAMAQGDQRNGDVGGCGFGRSSKKPKQKKVPQRGLGVAQLEKIRLEEQQKRDAALVLPSNSSSSLTKPPYLPLPINNFDHSNHQQSSTLPLPCGPPSDFRSLQQQQHMDGKFSTTVPLANSAGFEEAGHKNPTKWWSSYEIDFDKDNFVVDQGLPFLPSLPLPNWVQRTPQYQPQTCSSMVNVSSGISSTTPVPVPHFSIEPPSNQNFSGNSVPVRPVEKLIGLKRPYPFSLDFPHAPAFNYKLPAFAEMRTNAKAPCNNGSGFNFDAGNSSSRETPSCSGSNSEPNSKKRNKENENFKGDFLSLAPPSPPSCPPSKFKTSSSFLAFHNQGYPEFESLSYQGNVEDQTPTPPMYRLFNQQKQPLYSLFLPEAKEEQIGQTTGRIQNCHEVGESIDLNLKL